MKTLIFLSILSMLSLGASESSEDSYDDYYSSEETELNCKIPNLEYHYWDDYYFKNDPIDDVAEGIILTVPKGNVTEIKLEKEGYITAAIAKDEIIFKTTKLYKDFEYLTETTNDNHEFSSYFKLICGKNDLSFTFKQPVNDTNNHTPFFNRKTYTYKFGMEINAGFDLTQLLSIFVTDIDINDTKLTYKLEGGMSSFLKVEQYKTINLGKSHYLRLTTVEKLPKSLNTEFKISAEDKGGKVGEATIKLVVL